MSSMGFRISSCRAGTLAARRPWFIICLAAKAPCRRRPVNSALGAWSNLHRHPPSPMKPRHKLPPWLRPRAAAPGLIVGLAWYTEEEWLKVRSAAADPDRFEETYNEWLQLADEALLKLRAENISARRSFIKAEDLLAWCIAHNKRNDAAARAEFVAAQHRSKAGEGSA